MPQSPDELRILPVVVDDDGDPVAGATIVVKSGTADLDGVATATTGDDTVATLDVAPELGLDQADGTL